MREEIADRSLADLVVARDFFGTLSADNSTALDQLSDHLNSLRYVAGRLDSIPADFWLGYRRISDPALPYLPMEITSWGKNNSDTNQVNIRQKHMYGDIKEGRGLFTIEVDMSVSADHDDVLDPQACERILEAYIKLRWHFGSKGLPPGVEEF